MDPPLREKMVESYDDGKRSVPDLLQNTRVKLFEYTESNL